MHRSGGLPENDESSRHARSSAWPLTDSHSNSWTFDPITSVPSHAEGRSHQSIFASTTSPSVFASASATTPPLSIPRNNSIGDEPARTPASALFNLDPLSSSPDDWRARQPEDDQVRATVNRRRLPHVEKDVDDPTQADDLRPTRATHSRTQSTTLTTLSRLFAVKAATSPTESRDYYSDHVQSNQIHRRCEL